MAKKSSSNQGNDKGGGNGNQEAANAEADGAPTMNVLGQYVKDLSFENPGAPNSLAGTGQNPNIQVNINVNAKALTETDYEVELVLEAKAVSDDKVTFNIELNYAGIFRVQNVPKESLQPVMLIECPRILFPFARQIVAGASRDGGFPPLMLDPIDFAALYAQRTEQQQSKTDA